MAITVGIQPSEETVVRYVRRPDGPPVLMITDGSATVWLYQQDSADGSMLVAEFAERLVSGASRWSEACRELAAPVRQRPYVSARR